MGGVELAVWTVDTEVGTVNTITNTGHHYLSLHLLREIPHGTLYNTVESTGPGSANQTAPPGSHIGSHSLPSICPVVARAMNLISKRASMSRLATSRSMFTHPTTGTGSIRWGAITG
ncbi:hypothetical protein G9A89_000264 [Geosiphon pyriformis]|nr:hypothetical protein G9A89_000264 [Geosiphon pyriformis]